MKKMKKLGGALIRTAIVLSPGIITGIALNSNHGWAVSTLAGLGVELIVGLVCAVCVNAAAQIKAQRDTAKEAEESAN